MLRIPRCLDSRLTDGGEVVSLKHRQRSTPQKYYLSASSTNFCYRLSEPQGLVSLLLLSRAKISALRPGIINYGASCFSAGNTEKSR
jgi:hypothetical protein